MQIKSRLAVSAAKFGVASEGVIIIATHEAALHRKHYTQESVSECGGERGNK